MGWSFGIVWVSFQKSGPGGLKAIFVSRGGSTAIRWTGGKREAIAAETGASESQAFPLQRPVSQVRREAPDRAHLQGVGRRGAVDVGGLPVMRRGCKMPDARRRKWALLFSF